MKVVGSVKENLDSEKRISITPETTKKLIDLKFNVFIAWQRPTLPCLKTKYHRR